MRDLVSVGERQLSAGDRAVAKAVGRAGGAEGAGRCNVLTFQRMQRSNQAATCAGRRFRLSAMLDDEGRDENAAAQPS